ncbi:MAG TPA: biosynthetic peptidoglycan transglycosylase [Niabella sp.]|nr:biosynthetic peptidoglycan transglycosylase [Niabella sp.]HMU05626.1 biosynthetic peptidoglycan transglycosylase [Saprospiraceae bacterium]
MDIYHDCKEADLFKCSVLFLLEGQTFFKSYPFFIVEELKDYNATGCVVLKLDYMACFSDFSSYYFSASTIENTFKLVNSQRFDLSYLNEGFMHCIKNDLSQILKEIDLSTANPNYLRLADIPEILITIIILTEDPHYYDHNGIHDYAIGLAIALNIKKRKFKRGGSTITMQLARNLFLYHSKTITRKLEELLFAWLIENHFNISKSTILEIYLNIIEFGESVYGIAMAAKYYFAKNVYDLSLTEYLVLSYIIPRPKFFLEAVLIESTQLKKNLAKHINHYGNSLLEQGFISKEEFKKLQYKIYFKDSIGILNLEEPAEDKL